MSQDERSSSILQYGDFFQGEYRHSELPGSKKGGSSGDRGEPPLSPKNMEVKIETSRPGILQLVHKLSCKTTGPGTSQSVDNIGDCKLDAGSKVDRMVQLEKTVNRLKYALVSLEEENLILNKKVKGGNLVQETFDRGGPGSTPKTPSETSSTEQALREKPKKETRPRNTEIRPEVHKKEEPSRKDPCLNDSSYENGTCPPLKEKQDVQKKLKKVEEYRRECTRELGRVLRKYEELRTHNRTLDKRCKQLTSENQRLTESLGSQKGETGGSEEAQIALEASVGVKALLEQAHECCVEVSRDKEQLEGKVAGLVSEAAQLREQCDCKIMRLRDEQAMLENCLRTVLRERDILQLEVRKLHQDYIELSSISRQLKAKSSSGLSASLGSHDPPSFSSSLTRQDKLIGRFMLIKGYF